MKLRNKKTGEIIDLEIGRITDSGYGSSILLFPVAAVNESYAYSSLAELNEEWEDYEPKGPLIKDERIRRAVRAWAEVEGETQVQVTHCRKHILSIWSVTKENGNIDFDCDIEDTFDEGFYSINQLCGEEEE